MDEWLMYALIVLGVVVIVLFISKMATAQHQKAECIGIAQLQLIASDVKRLHSLARQDRNLLLALLHISSALSKLGVLHQLNASKKLAAKVDLDFENVRAALIALQQEKLHELNESCPELNLDFQVEDWSV